MHRWRATGAPPPRPPGDVTTCRFCVQCVRPSSRRSHSTDSNDAVIRNAYEAFSRGDIPAAMAAFAEEILWHVPGRGPLSRDYHGRDEVLGFFARVNALSGGTFRAQIDVVLAKGDRVIVLCTERARRGDRTWASPQVHAWTLMNGKATVFRHLSGRSRDEASACRRHSRGSPQARVEIDVNGLPSAPTQPSGGATPPARGPRTAAPCATGTVVIPIPRRIPSL
jgi:ketosteroid isomerase-like protein